MPAAVARASIRIAELLWATAGLCRDAEKKPLAPVTIASTVATCRRMTTSLRGKKLRTFTLPAYTRSEFYPGGLQLSDSPAGLHSKGLARLHPLQRTTRIAGINTNPSCLVDSAGQI